MKKDIRFLVTNSCNYGCYFCHAEGVSGTLGKNELTVENYITLFNLYSELEGWNGVTLSGGEPFLFRDIDELLKRLYEAGAQVTVVTNGALLDRHLPAIKYIKRINVSIHTQASFTFIFLFFIPIITEVIAVGIKNIKFVACATC